MNSNGSAKPGILVEKGDVVLTHLFPLSVYLWRRKETFPVWVSWGTNRLGTILSPTERD